LQLLEEILDSGGHPLTTSPNALRDIVLPPSLISKLLANLSTPGPYIFIISLCIMRLPWLVRRYSQTSWLLGAGGVGPAIGAGAFASPIPWRKAGLRYNNNDIYFDVVEELRAIVNK
jgi:AP-3 complex subunit mu